MQENGIWFVLMLAGVGSTIVFLLRYVTQHDFEGGCLYSPALALVGFASYFFGTVGFVGTIILLLIVFIIGWAAAKNMRAGQPPNQR